MFDNISGRFERCERGVEVNITLGVIDRAYDHNEKQCVRVEARVVDLGIVVAVIARKSLIPVFEKIKAVNAVDKAVVRHHIVGIDRVAIGILDKDTHIIIVCRFVEIFGSQSVLVPAFEDIRSDRNDVLGFFALVVRFERNTEREPQQGKDTRYKDNKVHPYRRFQVQEAFMLFQTYIPFLSEF